MDPNAVDQGYFEVKFWCSGWELFIFLDTDCVSAGLWKWYAALQHSWTITKAFIVEKKVSAYRSPFKMCMFSWRSWWESSGLEKEINSFHRRAGHILRGELILRCIALRRLVEKKYILNKKTCYIKLRHGSIGRSLFSKTFPVEKNPLPIRKFILRFSP